MAKKVVIDESFNDPQVLCPEPQTPGTSHVEVTLPGDQNWTPPSSETVDHQQIHQAPNGRACTEYVFAFAECVVVALYGLFVRLSPEATPGSPLSEAAAQEVVERYYPFFQDVHVMIFIGFGFLMTFVKTHRWSALSFNFLMSIWALQWGILSIGFWYQVIPGGSGGWQPINLNIAALINGDFAAAAAMIAFGAIFGKCNLAQLTFLIFWQMILCGLNEAICLQYLKAKDMGGSIVLHAFGAYFGLAASYFFQPGKAGEMKVPTSYDSQTVAMLGTLFLWIFWPSFNGALAVGAAQHWAVLNTVLSVGGGCIGAACITRILLAKKDMEVMLNATLAGGVAMGSACDIVASPWAAIFIGFCAGGLSAIGFRLIGPFLSRRINLQDTCGVHSLHGIPGILGAVTSAIAIALSGHQGFPADYFPVVASGGTLSGQVATQFYALLVTLGIAVAGGLAGGWICSLRVFQPPTLLHQDDDHFWEVCYN